ncbi:MAG: nucleotide exchange factor GrpE [Planctomycetaceae bacterium]|nr:nucleotide exchange factor GrpE [Planctomycetaceae bacterium]
MPPTPPPPPPPPPSPSSRAAADAGLHADVPGDGAADGLPAMIDRLAAERDEAVAARTRALADFANFQRRSVENEARARTAGLVQLARALMPVLDNFDLTLAQDPARMTVEQMAKSIEMTRAELQKALEQNGISRIDPVPGAEFDPMQHDAVMRQPAEGVAPNCVSMRFQTGWRLGESVLRPAKVAVAPDA